MTPPLRKSTSARRPHTARLSRGGRLAGALLALALLACSGDGNATEPGNGAPPPSPPGPPPPPPPPPSTSGPPRLEEVARGLDFPLYLTSPPADARLFIVEKGGRVRIVRGGQLLPEPFLDISSQVSRGSEQGLLSMAFHPQYASNGRFFVYFTNPAGNTRVVEYRASSEPDRADPGSARTLLEVDQPFANHNGGLVLFGPDGKLYVGLGDGGSGGDPLEAGQDLGTLLGKILRLDVDVGSPYAVPPDNPFVGRGGARGEIWAYGLRNPWRFSFDRRTGDFFVADVGQNRFEEVNALPAGDLGGENYGWDVMEGKHCFEPESGCPTEGLTLPVVEYGRADRSCSVTGGYVYRGEAFPDLQGLYFFSDFCSAFVRSFRLSGGAATDERSWPDLSPPEGNVSSFGEDAAGELYILSGSGTVYRISPS
ncbi:MAG: sorbosone dehydrogenase family protein [Gemmatimonadota bacterium]